MGHVRLFSLVVSSLLLLQWAPPDAVAGEDRCQDWVARVVSVQGLVQMRRGGEMGWVAVTLNDTFCPGDMIRVQDRSRAAVVLSNESTLRLDQKTAVTFHGVEKRQTSLIDVIKGAIHFFSRRPRALKIATPFVNGGVEGTEFFLKVDEEQTLISVFEGEILAGNDMGSLRLQGGETGVARRGVAPKARIVARPRDAVQWALYYPPILDVRALGLSLDFKSDWQGALGRSIEFFRKGDLRGAFSSLETVRGPVDDPRFYTYRAGLLLTVGRPDEAIPDIERALGLDPMNSHAWALRSVPALVGNKKDRALELAAKAVALDPASPTARVALSYAQQAHFDLEGAVESLEQAVVLDRENALAWARLAELWLSEGYLDKALEAAQKGASLNPLLERTQTVLGYAFLTQIKIRDAKIAFKTAVKLDPAAPLPRLGLGLSRIREGALEEGRMEIEIAVGLDPHNALIRSYLGKAFFEERRDALSGAQYAVAKELDPADPTPWFYDAIRKQAANRPVEALHDLQESIALNDNRAVYRSRLMLDEDMAARSAGLGRIFRDLGFEQLALVEGWKSVNADPANHSGHRLLADSYSTLPRHEIARVSEVLQSQLLQPINVTPVQPSLTESNLFILEGAGPADPAFNEYNPLFLGNRLTLQGSGLVGEHDTLGAQIAHSGVWGMFSYSLGRFHHETEGFRENNDREQDTYNVFTQASLQQDTSLMAELRRSEVSEGDLPLRFNRPGRDNFSADRRKEEENTSIRFGVRHAFSPHSTIIAHVTRIEGEERVSDSSVFTTSNIAVKDEGYMAEAQYLFSSEVVHLTGGISHYSAAQEEFVLISSIAPPVPLLESSTPSDVIHTHPYVYANLHLPGSLHLTLGAGVDCYDDDTVERTQFSPKLGLVWDMSPGMTFRAAGSRTLKRTLASSQTIEPTHVAGFNQLYDDANGTDAWRYGVAMDRKFSETLYGGLEYSERHLDVPLIDLTRGGQINGFDWDEELARAYIYWTPLPTLALRAEYLYEHLERDPGNTGEEGIRNVDTHRIPLGVNAFHPCGLSAHVTATYVRQDGEFGNPTEGFFSGQDAFWVVDAFVGYRFRKRFGILGVGVKNLFDEAFSFQDTDVNNQRLYPDRCIYGRLTIAF